MRIISGTHRGKKLLAFPGKTIRPTSDRLREAIFNILSNRVHHAEVLDLFAGTGALGIEALSRGADRATFIEKDRAAVSILKENLRSCGFEDRARAIQWDILKNLTCIQSDRQRFNLVFMDPPYDKEMLRPALEHVLDSRILENQAVLVVEHSRFDCVPNGFNSLRVKDTRKYGKSLVSFLEFVI